jgi:hypothetical protein
MRSRFGDPMNMGSAALRHREKSLSQRYLSAAAPRHPDRSRHTSDKKRSAIVNGGFKKMTP